MNLVPGEIVRDGEAARFRGSRFEIALPPKFKSAKPGAATLGIRPEHVALDGTAQIELPVRLIEPLGRDTLFYFDAGSERAFIAVSEGIKRADIRVGARMGLSFDSGRMYLFDADGRRIE